MGTYECVRARMYTCLPVCANAGLRMHFKSEPDEAGHNGLAHNVNVFILRRIATQVI
jgi:hypothetical protein